MGIFDKIKDALFGSLNNSTYSIEPLQNIKSIDEIKLTNNDLVIESNRSNPLSNIISC